MSDKQSTLDRMAELEKTATDLGYALDQLRDEIETGWQTAEEFAEELADDLDANTPVMGDPNSEIEAAWNEGWEAAIDHIRQTYGV